MEQELRRMFEMKESEMAVPSTLPPELRTRVRRQRMVMGGLVAAAAIAVVLGGFAGARSLSSDDAAPVPPVDRQEQEIEQPAPPQMTTIRQVADAINARDTGSFIDGFRRDEGCGGQGSSVVTSGCHRSFFSPRGIFPQGCVLVLPKETEGHHALTVFHNSGCADSPEQEEEVEAWMAINEAWGLEADLIACSEELRAVRVRCEVATRWHTLSLEIREAWVFEFEGTKLISLQLSGSGSLVDLNPSGRVLTLGYDGLEDWEEWLTVNNPKDATRYLNRRQVDPPNDCESGEHFEDLELVCEYWDQPTIGPLLYPAEEGWSITGIDFRPDGLIPYDPAFADEIGASIQDYLSDR